MLMFLMLNKIELVYSQQELIDVILAVASGKSNLDDLVQWVLEHQL